MESFKQAANVATSAVASDRIRRRLEVRNALMSHVVSDVIHIIADMDESQKILILTETRSHLYDAQQNAMVLTSDRDDASSSESLTAVRGQILVIPASVAVAVGRDIYGLQNVGRKGALLWGWCAGNWIPLAGVSDEIRAATTGRGSKIFAAGKERLHQYDPSNDQWTLLAAFRLPRRGALMGIVEYKEDVIIVGGLRRYYDIAWPQGSAQAYNVTTKTMRDFPMPNANFHFAQALVCDGHLFVVGQLGPRTLTLYLSRFEPSNRSWIQCSFMQEHLEVQDLRRAFVL